ncbi:DUF2281 domain-containing protein [Geminocystis herdmanii]|uniref:DUF2281 domain-containing protein n=1 Tax=Geminocystis herdmanii TaxID=669359 RepID=UPI0003473DEC|nr:DUF2281 domain-containing protein [Geminocystis herdmanii]
MTNLTIDLTATILTKIKDLPLAQQQEIIDFIEFIRDKHTKDLVEKNKYPQKRIAGLYKGKGWISEDFNQPLPPDFLG